MKLDEVVTWYQKKIGTYDKQQWEKTVEQKILDGLTSVTLKNARLKTEFIDVDLVRGSTFPKAKPKQSLSTVIRLAILRYFLLPVYAKWWVQQTSHKVFGLLLFLYVTQMISWSVYTFKILHRLDDDVEHIVSISELLIPMALSLILSFIHSQIVATSSGSGLSSKQHRYSNAGGKPRERVKRRRKILKMRSFETECPTNGKPTRSRASTPLESTISLHPKTSFVPLKDSKMFIQTPKNSSESHPLLEAKQSLPSTDIISSKLTLDLTGCCSSSALPISGGSINECKKRNVNWDTPIHNFATEANVESQLLTNISPQASTTSNSSVECSPREEIEVNKEPKTQEHEMDLNKIEQEVAEDDNRGRVAKRSLGEDDGFESLNGKSSSGEENNIPAVAIGPNAQPTINEKNHLRLRLNENITRARDENSTIEEVFNANTPILPVFRRKYPLSSESDIDRSGKNVIPKSASTEMFAKKNTKANKSSDTDTEESDEEEIISSPASLAASNYTECTTSATEWLGVTTNSEECSYSSELDNSDYKQLSEDEGYDMDFTPTTILNPHGKTGRISCTIWENRDIKKAQMSVLDISSCIIERVEAMPETCDYIYFGICFSIILSMIPPFCRLCEKTIDSEDADINYLDIPMLLWEKASFSFIAILRFAFGNSLWERALLLIGFMQRLLLTLIFFMLFAVAERTFKQRFLYAKLFSHLTSSRRARKSDLPHFRLNKVRNIKTWLSVRSYLKKRGPQRSVDVIVSAAFLLTLLLLAFLSVEWLKDSVHLHSHLNLEALTWSTFMGIFLLRFMTLGNKINRKYRSISVLITEQINLYLQIEQKPKKKDELMVSNSVLKLAADLLKELELPFKISGLSANPYLYTTIKVVILSALSGVLSEMLGFKLKLHKIKIK
ncbi:protein phtf [Eupeodes corollae]|uniref:protein phtf n=1 Tax=Eupeodes corollae TaxID=290404 RepID=UPI002492C6F2|nr:protein phtf [Eupeodes corollae]